LLESGPSWSYAAGGAPGYFRLKTGFSSMPVEQRIPWTTKPILIQKIRTLQSSATHQNARLRLYPHPRNLRVVGSSLVSCVCPASAEAESVAHRPDGVAETPRRPAAPHRCVLLVHGPAFVTAPWKYCKSGDCGRHGPVRHAPIQPAREVTKLLLTSSGIANQAFTTRSSTCWASRVESSALFTPSGIPSPAVARGHGRRLAGSDEPPVRTRLEVVGSAGTYCASQHQTRQPGPHTPGD
jgi:hypothetical protein